MLGRREGEEEKERAEKKKVMVNKASSLPGFMPAWWCGKVCRVNSLLSNGQRREAKGYGLLMTMNFSTPL